MRYEEIEKTDAAFDHIVLADKFGALGALDTETLECVWHAQSPAVANVVRYGVHHLHVSPPCTCRTTIRIVSPACK